MTRTLEDLLGDTGNPVELLRNAQRGPNVYPGVPAEYSNWRDEMEAWQKTCVLFNQSYHMAELAVRGPDAERLLSDLAINTFNNFTVDKAKQFVPCTPEGYVIGDVILFHLDDDHYNLVGRSPAHDGSSQRSTGRRRSARWSSGWWPGRHRRSVRPRR
jgi:glycine cleavage system aminomethyltransferase T